MSDFQSISNKKAYFDYEILEKIEAGIVLSGPEVKSIRDGKANLKGSYVAVLSNIPYVIEMHITEYPFAKVAGYEPKQKRALLLRKSEIEKLLTVEKTTGLSVIPLKLYFKRGLAKLEIGIGKGKKNYDKRDSLKKSAQKMEIQRAIKHF